MIVFAPSKMLPQSKSTTKFLPWVLWHDQPFEIHDLWYERRKGPTSKERQAASAFGRKLKPEGRFSALCHAKFEDVIRTWSSSEYPLVSERQLYVIEGREYHAVDADYYVRHPNGFTAYAWWLVPRDSGLMSIVAILQLSIWPKYNTAYGVTVSCRQPSALASSSYYQQSFWYDSGGQWAIDQNVSYESVVAHLSNRMPDPKKMSYTTAYFNEKDSIYMDVPSPETIQQLANQALHSALRYDDQSLVDWSVDERAPMPQSLQNIDLVEGKAESFIEATKEIPLASENMLQNIACAFLGMTAFAFNSEGASKAFNVLTRGSPSGEGVIGGLHAAQTARTSKMRLSVFEEHCSDLIHSPVDPANKAALGTSEKLDYFGDKWLTGRYVFSTGVVDMGNTWEYFYDQALQWIGKRSGDYKCHARIELRDFVFQCTYVAREKALEGFQKFCQQSYRLGTDINMYVLWDFVPFSFVVDWFVPIGNSLNDYTRASKFCPEYWAFRPHYDGNAFCYSIQYKSETFFGTVSVYTRWYERECPPLDTAIILRQESPSNKTCCKRVIDGLALFHL